MWVESECYALWLTGVCRCLKSVMGRDSSFQAGLRHKLMRAHGLRNAKKQQRLRRCCGAVCGFVVS
jgi:hypothetical protein